MWLGDRPFAVASSLVWYMLTASLNVVNGYYVLQAFVEGHLVEAAAHTVLLLLLSAVRKFSCSTFVLNWYQKVYN